MLGQNELPPKSKKSIIIIILVLVMIASVIVAISKNGEEETEEVAPPVTDSETALSPDDRIDLGLMELTSPVFQENGNIPDKYTCTGEDVSPPLNFSNVPDEAQSLVLIVDDPDAPVGIWDHWIVFNIDPTVTEVAENSVPKGGVLGTNDFGKLEYGGPCPPSGTHRYFFKLYSLDKLLDLDEGATKEEVLDAIDNHVLSDSQLMGLYSK